MRSRRRTFGSVLLLQASYLASEAVGGPVLSGETGPPLSPTPVEVSAELERAVPAGASSPQGGATFPSDLSQPVVTPGRLQNPAIAARTDPARMQPPAAGLKVNRDPGRTKAAAPRPRPEAEALTTELSVDDDIDPDLKDAVKTALQWAQEAKERVQPARAPSESEMADAPASAPVGAAADSQENMRSDPEPRTEYQPTIEQGRPPGPRTGDGLNLIRAGLALVRSLLLDPVTWLVTSLMVLGGLMLWVVQGQARLRKHKVPGRAARGQHGSSKPTREVLERASDRNAQSPPVARSSDKTRVRTTTRRAAMSRGIT
jgi:hypothetical protein